MPISTMIEKVFKFCFIVFFIIGIRVSKFSRRSKTQNNSLRTSFSKDALIEFFETLYFITVLVISVISFVFSVYAAYKLCLSESTFQFSMGIMMSFPIMFLSFWYINAYRHNSAIKLTFRNISKLVKLMDQFVGSVFPKSSLVIITAAFILHQSNMFIVWITLNSWDDISYKHLIRLSIGNLTFVSTFCFVVLALFHIMLLICGKFFDVVTLKINGSLRYSNQNFEKMLQIKNPFKPCSVESFYELKSQVLLLDQCQELIMSFFCLPILDINLLMLASFCVSLYLNVDGFFTDVQMLTKLCYGLSPVWNVLFLLILHYPVDIFRNKVRF